jgi:hypothetical protein
MRSTVDDLLEASRVIGEIVESNGQYTDGLVRRIERTGKTVNELTVCELMALHAEHNEYYNKIFGGSDAN